MIRNKHLPTLFASLLLVACVTINIYFPAAAAEKAADIIIKDVLGDAPASETTEPGPSSDGKSSGDSERLEALLGIFIASAHAAEADISISTPAIDGLRAAMKARHSQLGPHYDSGAIGYTRAALVMIRDISAIPLPSRNQVKKLVADENTNRNALYREIARANGHPEWENDIRETFARRWIANAHAGWWYQDSGGAWRRK